MPLYVLENIKTKESFQELCSWNQLQEILASNPEYKLLPAAPAIVSGVSGRYKTDEGFKDILRTIKKRHRNSTIDVT